MIDPWGSGYLSGAIFTLLLKANRLFVQNLASLDLKLTDELLAGIKRIHTEQPNPTPGVIALGSVDRDCLGKPIAEPPQAGFERQERPYA